MDLWDVTSNFLVSNVTSKNFRLNDVLALANHLKIQLKPPRNANSGQLTFILRDLLDVAKAQYPVLDFVYRISQVKPFEATGIQLKDRLMSESIMCMNGTLRTVYDQQKEITRYIFIFDIAFRVHSGQNTHFLTHKNLQKWRQNS